MRMLLSVKKGAPCYDDLKTIDGFNHKSFREACFVMGFLQDDKEFIKAIK